MNTTLVRPTLAALCRIVLGSSIAIGLASGSPAIAHGGGGGGGGGGHGGGGGGHMGGGGFHGGGFGWGHGGFMGGGFHHRGFGYGGYYPGFFGFGYPWYGYGYGYPGYGYGYGYPDYGYGYGYPDYGYGYNGYGSGYYYPDYTYGTVYSYPSSSYVVTSNSNAGYAAAPGSGYTYSSAYGTVPLQAATPAPPSSFPLPSLGIDEQKVSDATGSHIQVTRVHPGSPAERAGLKVGDTIVSANGYLTQDPGNLAWIINHHAPNGVVTLNIRKVANGQATTVNATLH
jgi:PDZ domain